MPGVEARNNSVEDRISGYWVSDWKDTGPRPGAMGEVIAGFDGRPGAYIVAPGDLRADVGARFCFEDGFWLEKLNQVRRTQGRTIYLYAGDTLNLNPYTVTSVGDENGVVQSNEPLDHLPPQR
ncbi:hypothetical protein QWJ90_12655 [Microbacterium oryzae]|uniref:hypothetical protein n=1 Tax=Microbacterium oryzae TaxID=743009 RepID=UPI0025B19CE8|nr:hypothetical protein [Microbacterium oryzae]MDN3311780.1 hypothetical protein [Microbacterium oryzae]